MSQIPLPINWIICECLFEFETRDRVSVSLQQNQQADLGFTAEETSLHKDALKEAIKPHTEVISKQKAMLKTIPDNTH